LERGWVQVETNALSDYMRGNSPRLRKTRKFRTEVPAAAAESGIKGKKGADLSMGEKKGDVRQEVNVRQSQSTKRGVKTRLMTASSPGRNGVQTD